MSDTLSIRTKWLGKKTLSPIVETRLQELLKMRLLKDKLKQSISGEVKLTCITTPHADKSECMLGSTETKEQYEKRIMNDPSAWTTSSFGPSRSILPR